MTTLQIKNLHVAVSGKEILKGVNLTVHTGEMHAIMGPNGTGKSTLSQAIMGHPAYQVTSGSITLDGQDLSEMAVDERARAGLFLAMQYPSEIQGSYADNVCCARVGRYDWGNCYEPDWWCQWPSTGR